jgi:hypothetical protein
MPSAKCPFHNLAIILGQAVKTFDSLSADVRSLGRFFKKI